MLFSIPAGLSLGGGILGPHFLLHLFSNKIPENLNQNQCQMSFVKKVFKSHFGVTFFGDKYFSLLVK